MLFVQALRACVDTGGGAAGWLAALRDPALSVAMHALDADLARPWTLAELAREAGTSRSTFAAALREKTGDTPLGYLTTWRLLRAERLVRDTS